MTISVINLGSIPLGTGGDTARLAFTKVNDNFANLDSRVTGNTTDIATNASDIILNASNIAAANAAAAAAQTSADTAAAAATNANTNANTRVLKSGDTMTGLLTLSAAPTANLHAATKLYADTVSAFSAGTGLSLTGKVFANTGVLSFNTRVGAVTLSSADVTTALTFTPYNATNPAGYISGITSGNVTTALGFTPENAANKGIASGYASLDSGGKIPSGQLPSIAVTDTFVVASQAAMLALTAQTGDVSIRTDLSKSFILQVNNPTILANWAELLSPSGAVTSITGTANQIIASGPTGAVVLSLPQNIHTVSTPTFGALILGAGNLNFTTTGQRIIGDFSNATVANRLSFQTSTLNGGTVVSAIPNGTATSANFSCFDSATPLNSSQFTSGVFGGSDVRIQSSAIGSGTYLPMTFWVGGSERIRIDASGNLSIGTAAIPGLVSIAANMAPKAGMVITGTTAGDAGTPALTLAKFDNNTTTAQSFIRFIVNNSATGSGQINANGASACAFGSFSDETLKENITELPPQLANIRALWPCEFDYKDGSGHQIGFIAQKHQKIYPDTIGIGENEKLTLTGWSKTEARLVKAIQELADMVEAQAIRIAALENKQ